MRTLRAVVFVELGLVLNERQRLSNQSRGSRAGACPRFPLEQTQPTSTSLVTRSRVGLGSSPLRDSSRNRVFSQSGLLAIGSSRNRGIRPDRDPSSAPRSPRETTRRLMRAIPAPAFMAPRAGWVRKWDCKRRISAIRTWKRLTRSNIIATQRRLRFRETGHWIYPIEGSDCRRSRNGR
jgi:hypothetical protein